MSAADLIAGIAMQQGTRIHLCIVGANRDRVQFPDPDRLDLARTPNRHLVSFRSAKMCFAWLRFIRRDGIVLALPHQWHRPDTRIDTG